MKDGITLDDLCRAYKVIELPNGAKVRVRVLSDTERRECDMEALRASSVLVKQLRDKDSKEYAALILPTLQRGLDGMKKALCDYRELMAIREVAREITPNYIPFPDDAKDDERRDVIERRTAHFEEIQKKRLDRVTEIVATFRKSLDDKTVDDITAMIGKYAEDGNADSLFQDEYLRWNIYLSCEKEDGNGKFFANIEAVNSLPQKVKMELFKAYAEVDSVDPFLFNKPSVTDTSTV